MNNLKKKTEKTSSVAKEEYMIKIIFLLPLFPIVNKKEEAKKSCEKL